MVKSYTITVQYINVVIQFAAVVCVIVWSTCSVGGGYSFGLCTCVKSVHKAAVHVCWMPLHLSAAVCLCALRVVTYMVSLLVQES